MPVPTYTPGQILAASDCNNWFLPLVGQKTSTQSVTNSTTQVQDTALNFNVAANAAYAMWTSVVFTAVAGADIQFSWGGPAGSLLSGTLIFRTTAGAAAVHGWWTTGTTNASAGSGSGTNVAFSALGVYTTSSTAGNFHMQWAQNVANATATSVQAGSVLFAFRIG